MFFNCFPRFQSTAMSRASNPTTGNDQNNKAAIQKSSTCIMHSLLSCTSRAWSTWQTVSTNWIVTKKTSTPVLKILNQIIQEESLENWGPDLPPTVIMYRTPANNTKTFERDKIPGQMYKDCFLRTHRIPQTPSLHLSTIPRGQLRKSRNWCELHEYRMGHYPIGNSSTRNRSNYSNHHSSPIN